MWGQERYKSFNHRTKFKFSKQLIIIKPVFLFLFICLLHLISQFQNHQEKNVILPNLSVHFNKVGLWNTIKYHLFNK